jgi:glycosyltransferase involved in cell wall biosynthesis
MAGSFNRKKLVYYFERLFVLPSYYEGLPIALLEALSYNLPVLVSNISQNREISLSEFRYFKVGDIDALTKKIIELFKIGISEEEKIKYRKILEENYNWNKIAERTYQVYKSVLNKYQKRYERDIRTGIRYLNS